MKKEDRISKYINAYFSELHKTMCLNQEVRDLTHEIESELEIDEEVTKIILEEWATGNYIEKQMERLKKAKEILDAAEIKP